MFNCGRRRIGGSTAEDAKDYSDSPPSSRLRRVPAIYIATECTEPLQYKLFRQDGQTKEEFRIQESGSVEPWERDKRIFQTGWTDKRRIQNSEVRSSVVRDRMYRILKIPVCIPTVDSGKENI